MCIFRETLANVHMLTHQNVDNVLRNQKLETLQPVLVPIQVTLFVEFSKKHTQIKNQYERPNQRGCCCTYRFWLRLVLHPQILDFKTRYISSYICISQMMAMSLIISKNISLLHLVYSISGAKFVNKNKQTNKQTLKVQSE